MSKLKLGSTWLSLLEQITYLCPSLATVLYYYFSEIEKTISWTSKASFGVSVVLLVLLLVYGKAFKEKLKDMRQGLVQSEYDLKNGVGDPDKITSNIAKDRIKLDTMNRARLLISLFILSLSVYILEQAAIGLTTLIAIAVASVGAGMGIHVGVIKLEEKESLKVVKGNEPTK